jgi:hypothetical protein
MVYLMYSYMVLANNDVSPSPMDFPVENRYATVDLMRVSFMPMMITKVNIKPTQLAGH